jgi:hypothetical protein
MPPFANTVKPVSKGIQKGPEIFRYKVFIYEMVRACSMNGGED